MGQSRAYTPQEELASKWLDQSITPQEEQDFADWYNKDQDLPLIISKDFARDYNLHKNRIYYKLIEVIGVEEPPKYKLWGRLISIAAIFVFGVVAIYFYIQYNRHFDLDELASNFHNGSSVAVLINENGKERLLKDSVFYAETNTDGKLISSADCQIITPKGGHYKIVLEDGTKVWVNADTKLVYPAVFSKSERIIKLYGEAYFEVNPDPKRPFRIQVATKYNKQDIIVLGTKFNVSGYDDDTEIRTTVYEGSVKVSSGKNHIILYAGDELSNTNGKLLTEVLRLEKNVNKQADHVHDIILRGDIFSCMRKISRLYNVSIVYDGVVKGSKLYGSFDRKAKLKHVLEIIELTGLYRFSIDKNTVIVTANADY